MKNKVCFVCLCVLGRARTFLRRDLDPYPHRESDPDPPTVNINPDPQPCLKEVVSEGLEDLEPDLGVLLVESLDLGAQLIILLQQRAQRLSLHSIVGIGKYDCVLKIKV